jgi:hypothetical protein
MNRLTNRIFPDGRTITRAMLVRWALFALAVGVAQWFRTDAEQALAIGYVAAGVALLGAARTQYAATAFLGFAGLAVSCAARVIVVPFFATSWDGVLIVVAAWGMYAYLAGERALSCYRTARRAP